MPKHKRAGETRQRFNAVVGRGSPVIIQQPRNCGDLQRTVIGSLAGFLSSELSPLVNYDHVKLPIPMSPVPLEFRHHRYDIAVLVDQRVILIDVLNIPLSYWDRTGETEHGEAQEQSP